jgi:uncharacterized Fe-S radical SAM superfamily protein PflX
MQVACFCSERCEANGREDHKEMCKLAKKYKITVDPETLQLL